MRLRSLTVALVAAAAVLLPAAPALAEAPTSPQILPGWTESGGDQGPLGDPVGGVVPLFDGGVKQEFEGGAVFWSPSTGSHAVHGPIWEASSWGSVGPGLLGYPTAAQVCGLRDGGCLQEFEDGAYYWVASIGATRVYAADRAVWGRHGGENGPLGYPRGDMLCGYAPDDSCLQPFEGGALYWSSGHRVRAAVVGDIYHFWSSRNARAAIGDPVSDQICGLVGGGCYQAFQAGSMHWSPATGAQFSRGGILAAYGRTGGEAGRLGYPTSSEFCGLNAGGCGQLFWNGAIYSSPATGAHVVLGAIRGAWNNVWSHQGRLGYPTMSEFCGLRGGGCFQEFQGGAIYWSPASGPHVVLGAIRESWARQGWETGRLGYPTTSEICGLRGGGCFQEFQGGAIYWSPASGAHMVVGGLRDAWARQGWETGRLGYPVGGEWFSGGAYRQNFQGGAITLDARGPRITYNR